MFGKAMETEAVEPEELQAKDEERGHGHTIRCKRLMPRQASW